MSYPHATVVWGLVSRGVGLTYLIAFISIAPQLLPIAGSTGLLPIQEALRAQTRDFPTWRRFFYFPTLLWFSASDRSLRILVSAGIAAAAASVIGGPQTPYAAALCWLTYLSLDRALTLIYPWDSLLLEAGFWSAFLPATLVLPDLASTAPASAPVAWAFRLLAFRVLFGFGKHKFAGSTKQDRTFLKGFLVSQPLPTYLGWLVHHAPLWLHVLGLYALFAIEVIAPFAVFIPGPLTTLAACAGLALMLLIQLCGNYGHFNLILSAVILSWFDNATARQLSLSSLASPVGVLFALHTLLALLTLPLNTFCSLTWPMWTTWRRIRARPVRALLAFARWLAPFRIVHPYGVFPPNSPPSVRLAPIAEVTWDEATWHELHHRYFPTQARGPLRICAPHHERFDQAVIYETLGLNEMSVFRGAIGRWDPYGHGGVSAAQRLLQRILQGDAPGDRFYDRSSERRLGAPRAIRVRMHMLTPTGVAEHGASGAFWKRELIGPHFPEQRLATMFTPEPLPPPELWHFEDVYWLQRSGLGRALRACERGGDPHVLLLDGAPELAAYIETFWNELVPQLQAAPRDSFAGLRDRVAALRERFGRQRLYAFERIAGRYAALLFARLEPPLRAAGLRSFFSSSKLHGVNSSYELRLLTHYIVSQGRDNYDAVIAQPARAAEHAARMTMFSAHCFQAIFRYEWLVHQSQKVRLIIAMTRLAGRPEPTAREREQKQSRDALGKRGFGVISVVEFLETQFTTEEHTLDIPEHWPNFTFDEHADVKRVT